MTRRISQLSWCRWIRRNDPGIYDDDRQTLVERTSCDMKLSIFHPIIFYRKYVYEDEIINLFFTVSYIIDINF